MSRYRVLMGVNTTVFVFTSPRTDVVDIIFMLISMLLNHKESNRREERGRHRNIRRGRVCIRRIQYLKKDIWMKQSCITPQSHPVSVFFTYLLHYNALTVSVSLDACNICNTYPVSPPVRRLYIAPKII